ncbi:MAG: hypothetical protein KJZ80_00210 [Hyphomicrobiaceae bacterium]|nr:hypothetical protein [Hyphomicrobiaceae bacterium]
MAARRARAACAAALMLLLPGPGQGADGEESWMPALRHVLASEKKCDMGDILWSREVPVGSSVTLEGRIRCLDGREFDFTRLRPHMKFDVRLCQPSVC